MLNNLSILKLLPRLSLLPQDQLNEAIAKTGQLSAISVKLVDAPCALGTARVVWVTHNFGFLGGSLGCAEGEKITRVRIASMPANTMRFLVDSCHPVFYLCYSIGI